jgi:hypothetical protein
VAKHFVVRLTAEERKELQAIVSKGRKSVTRFKHSQILLQADVEGPGLTDEEIARGVLCHPNTVANIRQRFVEQGLPAALERKKQDRLSRQRVLDGVGEARLIALGCSAPPEGRCRWTLKLLADKLVELEIVPSISVETVRTVLKKNELRPHLRACWVIPPTHNGDFVANMEDVLDVYQRPRDPDCPVVCLDEQPVQLVKETKIPLPPKPGRPQRYDYEYERVGTSNNFMLTAPLEQWRRVSVRDTKTSLDWAQEVRQLVEEDFPNARKVILVCDNLSTHKVGALYEAFPPEVAGRIRDRLEIHFTPKHGSWLNIAEIELSVLTKQCLNRRMPDTQTLRREVTAWSRNRNNAQKGVKWQFTTPDARTKLDRLYPQIQI